VAFGAVLTRQGPDGDWQGAYWGRFRGIATWAVWAMVLSGVALLFDRLSYPRAASTLYLGFLGGKIGVALGINHGTVKSRVHRARVRLAQLLNIAGAQEFGPDLAVDAVLNQASAAQRRP